MRILSLTTALVLLAAPALAGPITLRANPVDDDGRVTLGDVFENTGTAADFVLASRAGPSVMFEASQLQAIASRNGLQWSNPQGLRRVIVREASRAPSPVAPGALEPQRMSSTAAPAAASGPAPGATAPILTYARNLAAGDMVQAEDVIWTSVQAHLVPAGSPRDPDQIVGLSARRALRAGAPVGPRDLIAPRVIARNDMVEVAFVSGGVTLTVTGRATRDAAPGEAVPILNIASGRTIDAVATGPGRAITGPEAQAARGRSQFASR